MKTLLALAVLFIASCTFKDGGRRCHRHCDPAPIQMARLMPNGPEIAAAQAKCAVVSGNPDVVAACARALRADICGNNTTHTVDGVLIEVIVGGRDLQDAEAVWTPGKATCVGLHTRPQIHAAAKACGVPELANCGIGPQMLVTRLPAGG